MVIRLAVNYGWTNYSNLTSSYSILDFPKILCKIFGRFRKINNMAKRQKVLVLYLKLPSLEGEVISWATFDGTGKKLHMTGDSDEPPYPTGLDALLDGWRLFQASQAIPEHPGQEFRTSYLKHEFFFEKLEEGDF